MLEHKVGEKEKMAKRIAWSLMSILNNHSKSNWRNLVLYGLWNRSSHPSPSYCDVQPIHRRTDYRSPSCHPCPSYTNSKVWSWLLERVPRMCSSLICSLTITDQVLLQQGRQASKPLGWGSSSNRSLSEHQNTWKRQAQSKLGKPLQDRGSRRQRNLQLGMYGWNSDHQTMEHHRAQTILC